MSKEHHLYEDAIGSAHASPHHNGSGGCQAECTGTGNDQNCDAEEQRKEEVVVALRQPLWRKHATAASHVPATMGRRDLMEAFDSRTCCRTS